MISDSTPGVTCGTCGTQYVDLEQFARAHPGQHAEQAFIVAQRGTIVRCSACPPLVLDKTKAVKR